MAEFKAVQAREIMNNNDEWNTEGWYAKFKDELFQHISDAALKGHDHLLLFADSWDSNDTKKNHLGKRLKRLGYSVSFRKFEETGEGIYISW